MKSKTIALISGEIEDCELMDDALNYVRGLIPVSDNPNVVIAAIGLIICGGVYVPPQFFSTNRAEQPPPQPDSIPDPRGQQVPYEADDETSPRLLSFSPRQSEVLELIRQGKPNKLIAHQLNMTESTVKVHVRTLMKKLKASNRTEVAYLANRLFTGNSPSDTPNLS